MRKGRRFPHTRGDGPDEVEEKVANARFSPHPWGWTAFAAISQAPGAVFPTPVGMDRHGVQHEILARGFPHTRGDGPPARAWKEHGLEFSPHPWGWTGRLSLGGAPTNVFPTPVGMDRSAGCAFDTQLRFPHTRGDGPWVGVCWLCRQRFSPHPWGWTVSEHLPHNEQPVFPTPVGMDRQ